MKTQKIKCSSCGSNLNLDLDNLMAYCPYCGEKLMIDMGRMQKLLIEKEKTKREEIKQKSEEPFNKMIAKYYFPIIVISMIVLVIMAILNHV